MNLFSGSTFQVSKQNLFILMFVIWDVTIVMSGNSGDTRLLLYDASPVFGWSATIADSG